MSTINGSGGATQNRTTLRLVPKQAGEFGGTYEGPAAAVLAKAQELFALGWACTYTCNASPIATLEFSTPTAGNGSADPPATPNEDYTDTFSVIRNTTQKELLASDHPLIGKLDEDNLSELKAFIAKPIPEKSPAFTNNSAESFNAAIYLYDLWRSGVRSVEVKQPVLRVTRVTNPLYDAPFDVSNVDSVLTTNQMIADSGVPVNFAIPLVELANRFASRAIQSGGVLLRQDSLELRFGWLKDVVTTESLGTRRNQYVIEYRFGLWDQRLYP